MWGDSIWTYYLLHWGLLRLRNFLSLFFHKTYLAALLVSLQDHWWFWLNRCLQVWLYTVFLRSDAAATRCSFCAATIWGRRLFLWKVRRHQWWLDKARTSETVMVARRCQWYVQPLSPAVSSGNDSYNTNSPSASVVTHKKSFAHVGTCRVY